MGRQYKAREFWQQLVEEFESRKDITQEVFAQEKGVKVGTFRYWLYQIRREARQDHAKQDVAVTHVPFIELVPSDSLPTTQYPSEGAALRTHFSPCPGGRLIVRGSLTLEFDVLPPAPYLAQLLNALE